MRRHFVLTHGRSGSNFLVNSINLHPHLLNFGEVLGDWTIPHKLYQYVKLFNYSLPSYIDVLYENCQLYYMAQTYSAISHLKKNKRVSFKKRSNVANVGLKDFAFLFVRRNLLDFLSNRADISIIYLHRKNLLDRYLSIINMNRSGIASTEKLNIQQKKIEIDVDNMVKSMKVFREEENAALSILDKINPNRILYIDYDDYFANPDSIEKHNISIFSFLGVEKLKLSSKQKKISTKPKHQQIQNFGDVEHALISAGYGKMLE